MITIADLKSIALFDGLDDGQLDRLISVGAEVAVPVGIELFHEGDPADHWNVLVDGVIELSRHVGREDVTVGALDVPGRWSGGFRAWDDSAVYLATGIGSKPGRLLRIPSDALRGLLEEWFPFGRHLLAGMSGTARVIEATARQRESLARLGTLAAGLAHELNNPAAAAIRNVAALQSAVDTVLDSLRTLSAAQITADQFAVLDALRDAVTVPTGPVDPLDQADLAENISSYLVGHGIEGAWDSAAQLAAAGIDAEHCAAVAQVVPGGALRPALTWLASTSQVTALLDQLADATRRISDLVAATRSYTQLDRAAAQTIDVTEGLESTLTMLAGKLTGITVLREYDLQLPRIDAYPGELNQVWTNLIDNSSYAMAGHGTLRVSARALGGGDSGGGGGGVAGHDGVRANSGVVVEIADTGTGMPPEVVSRAFDAFYTTKEVGVGTGLGLDIAHRVVVERHGGTIEIESEPGRTVPRVTLPRVAKR